MPEEIQQETEDTLSGTSCSVSIATEAPVSFPLTITHLFILTGCVAFHLMMYSWFFPYAESFGVVILGILNILGGAAITGIPIIVSLWRRVGRARLMSGEWLWLALGSQVALIFPVYLPEVLGFVSWQGFPNFVDACCFVIPAIVIRKPILWRLVFLLTVTANLWMFFSTYLSISTSQASAVTTTLQSSAGLALLVAMCFDLRHRHSLRWTHWTGSGLYLLVFVSSTALWLLF